MTQAAHPAYLTCQHTEALKIAHGRALAAAAVHQARGLLHFAKLCEDRATEVMAVLADRAKQVS